MVSAFLQAIICFNTFIEGLVSTVFLFTAFSPSSSDTSRLQRKLNSRLAVAAITGKPVQGRNQLRRQLNAAGIDIEASLENLAAPGSHVQVAAGGLSVEDGAPLILQFFKAAEATLFAEVVPVVTAVVSISHGREGKPGKGEVSTVKRRGWENRDIPARSASVFVFCLVM